MDKYLCYFTELIYSFISIYFFPCISPGVVKKKLSPQERSTYTTQFPKKLVERIYLKEIQIAIKKFHLKENACTVSHRTMWTYNLKVATGNDLEAGTCNNVFIVLVGVNGESEKHQLPRHCNHYLPGSVAEFDINVKKDLGEILFVQLSMERYLFFPVDEWFCHYVHVTCPSGQIYQFPFYRWLSKFTNVEIPEGKAIVLTENTHSALKHQRKVELEKNRETYKWKVFADGVPNCFEVRNNEVKNLPSNDRYSLLKECSFGFAKYSIGLEMKLKRFSCNTDSWHNLKDIKMVSSLRRSQISDIVSEIWKEDSFFGSQYLNGTNPTLIKKCFKIPKNFPVDEHMVAPSLGTSTNLKKELKDGNIFLADYKILKTIPKTNNINGKDQYIAAPMCLLWKNPQHQIVPIAIQLSQIPGNDAPIFLPSDSEYDWLLAKIWVRSSEFLVHEADSHYLRTHLLAEAFSVATLRQLPMGHPVYKLIIPHVRYTLEINVVARKQLVGPNSFFDQVLGLDNEGIQKFLKKAMKRLTYSSLCLPDNIKSRDMESIPNYLYRDDGMKIWSAVESFVSNIVNLYYTSDEMVMKDPELQAWVAEIFIKGFLQNKSSEVPSCLESKASLIKYLTMVIFTCSAQHAAVNSGQFDIYSWMPNGPSTMKSPPPTTKGITTMESILNALPDVNTTAIAISGIWALSTEPMDRRRLGSYPDVRFTEEPAQTFIKEFQDRLAEISTFIQERNKTMDLPYPYLDPSVIENSISI